MENDQRNEHFHNVKRGFKEMLSNRNKEEICIDSANSKTNCHTLQVSIRGGKINSNTNSPKMGSRRIFTPQFKLQVLESYRNDHDCKGNQRATARKYNIHRRQIQKWLQCESNLRSSVANINQNSVKHQFHNVSMPQQQPNNVLITSQTSVNGLSYTSSQLHSAQLCLDSPQVKRFEIPSEALDIVDSNLAAVVPAASETIVNTSSTSSVTVESPLRPSAIISANRMNTNSSPLLHHHYGIPNYTNISPTATVPILMHHLNNSQQTGSQYNNLTYTVPPVSHHQTEKQHVSYFMPYPILLESAPTSLSYTGENNEYSTKLDLSPVGTKTYPKVPEKDVLYTNKQFLVNYEYFQPNRAINSNALETLTIGKLNGDSSYSNTYPFGPMDLSLRHNREAKSELVSNIQPDFQINKILPKNEGTDNAIGVVDLTYRKRRVFNTYSYEHSEKQQKLSVFGATDNKLDTYNTNATCANHLTASSSNINEDEDIEIEVGTEEKFYQTSKPVKLFKPYLLGENNVEDYIDSNRNILSKNEKYNEIEQIAKQVDSAIKDNTFLDSVKDNIDNKDNFLLEYRSESSRSTCSPPEYISPISPTIFQYCKESPASSGYESSTSTYSDTSLSSKIDMHTYRKAHSLNLQTPTLYHETMNIFPPSTYVQKWLEITGSKSPKNLILI